LENGRGEFWIKISMLIYGYNPILNSDLDYFLIKTITHNLHGKLLAILYCEGKIRELLFIKRKNDNKNESAESAALFFSRKISENCQYRAGWPQIFF
jgi:hypothetical protein